MRIVLVAIFLFLTLVGTSAKADYIEFDLNYTLGLISGTFGEDQTLSGVSTFFPDDAFYLDLGDTLVFNILFDQRLQVFEFFDPPGSTNQYFSFGLEGPNSFSGTWTSSVEVIGGLGNIWSEPITKCWNGPGCSVVSSSGGFGWGADGIQITDSQGSFTGIRWTTTITGISEGGPIYLSAFTGVQMGADGIRIIPVPEPGTLALFGIGLAGLGLTRRRKKAYPNNEKRPCGKLN